MSDTQSRRTAVDSADALPIMIASLHTGSYVPGSPTDPSRPRTGGDAAPAPWPAAWGARVLKCFVVEDSPVIRQNLVATLQELLSLACVGHAEDEAGALDWIRGDAACDLMIIDIFLKSGSGLEVLRQARVLRPACKLVVLTNYATADMRRRCTQLGADRVFDKSAELEELLAYCEGLAAGRVY